MSMKWKHRLFGTWTLKSNPAGGDSFSLHPPFSLRSVGDVDFDGAGEVLALMAMTDDGDAEGYGVVAAMSGPPHFPRMTVGGYECRAHLQDAIVVESRIFALVNHIAIAPPPDGLPVPQERRFIMSEVREYKLALSGGDVVFELVDTLGIGKYSAHMAYHVVSGAGYLFVPCPGSNSGIVVVKILPDGGFEGNGGTTALPDAPDYAALYGCRSVAIAADGTTYFLCGNYDYSNIGFNCHVYETTAARLVGDASDAPR